MISRRMLMAFEPEERPEVEEWYVQDGLVLHLDGIYNDSYVNQTHKDNPTVWNDLSGNGNHFYMYNSTTTEDSFKFSGSKSCYGKNNFSLVDNELSDLLKGVKTRTIEIVCKLNNTDAAQTIFLGAGMASPIEDTAAGMWYRPASNGMKISTADGSLSYPYTTTNPTQRNHYYATYNSSHSGIYDFAQNGVACSRGTAAGNMSNPTYITIGARYYNSIGYPLNGEICAIRVYNRQLTTQEKAQNLNLDIRRFGLSATPVTVDE